MAPGVCPGARVVPGCVSEAKLSSVFPRYKVAAGELHSRAATCRVADRILDVERRMEKDPKHNSGRHED